MKYLLITGAVASILAFIIFSGNNSSPKEETNHIHKTSYSVVDVDTTDDGEYPFQHTDTEWKQILTSSQYRILREGGTELPWANEYYDNKKEGVYICAACGQKLYSSEHKYKSGSGWPSFWKPIDPKLVNEKEDDSWFMTRTEIVCSNCGSHIGHVFDDGPEPTGLRYCMNSAAMKFIPEGEATSSK